MTLISDDLSTLQTVNSNSTGDCVITQVFSVEQIEKAMFEAGVPYLSRHAVLELLKTTNS